MRRKPWLDACAGRARGARRAAETRCLDSGIFAQFCVAAQCKSDEAIQEDDKGQKGNLTIGN